MSGGLAQLARAPALQAGGQRFESVILHTKGKEDIDNIGSEDIGASEARESGGNAADKRYTVKISRSDTNEKKS